MKVFCVRTGNKYPIRYVLHLHQMIARHLPVDHEFFCLTDQPSFGPADIHFIDITKYGLKGWFAKMLIFNREVVGDGRILYIDLDMVIARCLEPLVNLDIDSMLGICENFTRIHQRNNGGQIKWPCGFGSCVMLLGKDYGTEVWDKFWENSWKHITDAKQFGDQYIIEKLTAGNAVLLQDLLPEGYFLHYRDFTDKPDPRAAILVFGGRRNPMNCQIPWIKQLWNCHEE